MPSQRMKHLLSRGLSLAGDRGTTVGCSTPVSHSGHVGCSIFFWSLPWWRITVNLHLRGHRRVCMGIHCNWFLCVSLSAFMCAYAGERTSHRYDDNVLLVVSLHLDPLNHCFHASMHACISNHDHKTPQRRGVEPLPPIAPSVAATGKRPEADAAPMVGCPAGLAAVYRRCCRTKDS